MIVDQASILYGDMSDDTPRGFLVGGSPLGSFSEPAKLTSALRECFGKKLGVMVGKNVDYAEHNGLMLGKSDIMGNSFVRYRPEEDPDGLPFEDDDDERGPTEDEIFWAGVRQQARAQILGERQEPIGETIGLPTIEDILNGGEANATVTTNATTDATINVGDFVTQDDGGLRTYTRIDGPGTPLGIAMQGTPTAGNTFTGNAGVRTEVDEEGNVQYILEDNTVVRLGDLLIPTEAEDAEVGEEEVMRPEERDWRNNENRNLAYEPWMTDAYIRNQGE